MLSTEPIGLETYNGNISSKSTNGGKNVSHQPRVHHGRVPRWRENCKSPAPRASRPFPPLAKKRMSPPPCAFVYLFVVHIAMYKKKTCTQRNTLKPRTNTFSTIDLVESFPAPPASSNKVPCSSSCEDFEFSHLALSLKKHHRPIFELLMKPVSYSTFKNN